MKSGHVTVPVALGTPEEGQVPSVTCSILVHWMEVAPGQLTANPMAMSLIGPLSPDVLASLPITGERMQELLNQVLEHVAGQMRAEATKLTIAGPDALKNLNGRP